MRSLRARRLGLPLALVSLTALAGCKKGDETPSTEALELIPADIQGTYGRTAEDAPGMQVTATGLEFDQMQLIIHEGKMEGSTVRVERATLQWKKLEPKTCNGTISRQGGRLLMSLYDSKNTEEKCESTLEAEWHRWEQLDALPEMIQGRYGSLMIEPDGMRLDIDWVHAEMKAGMILELPGSNDERAELLIRNAKVEAEDDEGAMQTYECTGTMKLEDGRLSTEFWVPRALVPEAGTEAANDPQNQAKLAANEEACDNWDGGALKWEVRLDNFPKQPIAFDGLSLSISEEQVVLESPNLRCAQEPRRTESVDSSARWGGAFGGERVTLGKAEPTEVSDDCKLNLRIFCELQSGLPAEEIDTDAPPSEFVTLCMEQAQHDLCPSSITVRALSDTRFRVHVEPPTFNAIACADPTGEFVRQ